MPEMLYQRDAYGQALVELGRQNPIVVVFDADLSSSTRTCMFAKEFRDRFFNFGVAEQNMMASSAGMASCGKIVFVSTFAIFASGRAWDQVRNTISYSNLNVKIVATHAGITVGPDGATHQAVEDIALMKIIPTMKIIVPADAPQAKEAVIAAFAINGPVYIRLGRAKVPTIEGKGAFEFGKAQVIKDGKDLTIIACGIMVKAAVDAAFLLEKEGISVKVLNIHTIKPIDKEAIIQAAKQTKHLVVCEEHTTIGGLASSVDEIAAENCPVRILRVGIKDRFGQSGEPEELINEYSLSVNDIVKAGKRAVSL